MFGLEIIPNNPNCVYLGVDGPLAGEAGEAGGLESHHILSVARRPVAVGGVVGAAGAAVLLLGHC